MDNRSHYLSYLLRLWQTTSHGEPHWLASLERPGTGERQGFASLKALFAFLEAQTREAELELGGLSTPETSRPAEKQGEARQDDTSEDERGK